MEKKHSYNWKFITIGGVTRVSIETGEDIAHLDELDQKMWTVLSCPVKGLEFDERTLSLMDLDNDGKIRVNEVIDAAKWLTRVITNKDLLLKQESSLPLSAINQDDEDGAKLYKSAKQILSNLGLKKDSISVEDTSDSIAIFAKTKFNGDGIITEGSADTDEQKQVINLCIENIGSCTDRSGEPGVNAEQIEAFYTACSEYATWMDNAAIDSTILPYGANTNAAYAAFSKIKSKIDDFFIRCKMVVFNKDTYKALEISSENIEALGDKNLSSCIDEIANYPIARINTQVEIPLSEGINPAWEADFKNLKHLIFDVDFADKKAISEADWLSIVTKFANYETWLSKKAGQAVESIGIDTIHKILKETPKEYFIDLINKDLALEAEANEIKSVDKLVHLYRDIYSLLRNFVTLSDFYSRNKNVKAVFQAGELFIDQRSCELCIKVSDMAKHNAMAAASGMYLIYCDCTSKVKNEKMTIVAVMTDGDVNNLMVGKNAIFYDRNGLDWDAVVTKIVDNPISIRQAFWSPYRKFGKFISDQIGKFAANQDNKITEQTTSKIAETGDTITAVDINEAKPKEQQAKQPFDIAKFCGIFAAIGMAIGYIGGFIVDATLGFAKLEWWMMIIALIGLMLIISGPSMLLAWMSLRKRNLSPILNANGWAVNAQAYVNIIFGATLTKMAKFPTINVKDPFARKKMAWWKKLLIWIAILGAIFCGLYFTNVLSHVGLPFRSDNNTEIVTDTTKTEAPATIEAPTIEATTSDSTIVTE